MALADQRFFKQAAKYQRPEMAGRRQAGRSVVVFSEQGLGDSIQVARYLPLLIQRGAKVTFLCSEKLVRLLRPLSAQVAFVASLAGTETFDFQCALMSLPLRLGSDLGPIPSHISLSSRKRTLPMVGNTVSGRLDSRSASPGKASRTGRSTVGGRFHCLSLFRSQGDPAWASSVCKRLTGWIS